MRLSSQLLTESVCGRDFHFSSINNNHYIKLRKKKMKMQKTKGEKEKRRKTKKKEGKNK